MFEQYVWRKSIPKTQERPLPDTTKKSNSRVTHIASTENLRLSKTERSVFTLMIFALALESTAFPTGLLRILICKIILKSP